MKNPKYVAYYRASTEEQRDGLGLSVQRDRCETFVAVNGGTIIEHISEIVSGGAKQRAGFNSAIELCKAEGAILLVHRIDRLSRGGFMTLATLEQEGIPFIEADAPFDSVFSKNIKFLVAKEEKEKIQARVKDSLGQIKKEIEEKGYYITKEGKKITSLGSPEINLTDEGRAKSAKIRRAKAIANENNRRAYAVVQKLRDTHSLAKIAKYLNDNGFRTSRGSQFYPIQISNLIKLYE
jgi:DNA invertase Pin-like site-specific DNA recombinase